VTEASDETLLSSTIPIELVVRGRRAVVVGGGGEAMSKLRRLARGGAAIEWWSTEGASDEELREAAALGAETRTGSPTTRELEGAAIVFVATAHEALGAELAELSRRTGALVCTLDRPMHSTFVNPAVAEGAGIRAAISTGGASPALAKRLRQELERALSSPELAAFVRRIAALRRETPRGLRGPVMDEALEGFGFETRWRFPRETPARRDGDTE
jgi:siroheme synthase-like protein